MTFLWMNHDNLVPNISESRNLEQSNPKSGLRNYPNSAYVTIQMGKVKVIEKRGLKVNNSFLCVFVTVRNSGYT